MQPKNKTTKARLAKQSKLDHWGPVNKITVEWNSKSKLWNVGVFQQTGGFLSFQTPMLDDAFRTVENEMERHEAWPD
jgi:hypothetical protein